MGLVNGRQIFRIMDTHGLPLEIINEELRAKGQAFNVVEFVEAALESGNFSFNMGRENFRIRNRLIDNMLPRYRKEFTQEVDKIAELKGWK